MQERGEGGGGKVTKSADLPSGIMAPGSLHLVSLSGSSQGPPDYSQVIVWLLCSILVIYHICVAAARLCRQQLLYTMQTATCNKH